MKLLIFIIFFTSLFIRLDAQKLKQRNLFLKKCTQRIDTSKWSVEISGNIVKFTTKDTINFVHYFPRRGFSDENFKSKMYIDTLPFKHSFYIDVQFENKRYNSSIFSRDENKRRDKFRKKDPKNLCITRFLFTSPYGKIIISDQLMDHPPNWGEIDIKDSKALKQINELILFIYDYFEKPNTLKKWVRERTKITEEYIN